MKKTSSGTFKVVNPSNTQRALSLLSERKEEIEREWWTYAQLHPDEKDLVAAVVQTERSTSVLVLPRVDLVRHLKARQYGWVFPELQAPAGAAGDPALWVVLLSADGVRVCVRMRTSLALAVAV